MADKIPPQNLEAEKSVLGSILLDKNAIIEVAQFLKPEHFYSPINGMIYEAILDLFAKGEPVDILTVSNELKKKKKLDKVGGAVYLTELAESVPTSSNSEYYGNIVKDAFVRRSLITVAGDIRELGYDEGIETIDVIDEAEKKLFQVASDGKKTDFIHIKDLLKDAYERAEELEQKQNELRGVPTGFKTLDALLGGLQDSNLVIVAARPSVGKSSFALDIARYASLKGSKAVGIFSLEMSNVELTDRLIAAQVGMNLWDYRMGHIKDDDMLERLGDVMGQLSEIDLYLDDTPGQTIMEIRTKARRLSMERKLDMIIIDYLQLIVSGRNIDNRVQEVGEISRALKNLARELKVPVVALSQLSRAVESRSNRTPQLSDLRESGCLSGDTQVMDVDNNKMYTMKELSDSGMKINVYGMDDKQKIKRVVMEKVFPSGTKKVFKLSTKMGKQIQASSNHPFYKKFYGWTNLENLKKGDRIAVISDNEEMISVMVQKQKGANSEYIEHGIEKQDSSLTSVIWDEILGIEALGEIEVFDATVSEVHNFVANGIVVHNSIEQDADVVIFINREEMYNPETEKKGIADIIIAKHRNGPIGNVELAFVSEQAKFADLAK